MDVVIRYYAVHVEHWQRLLLILLDPAQSHSKMKGLERATKFDDKVDYSTVPVLSSECNDIAVAHSTKTLFSILVLYPLVRILLLLRTLSSA
jgi:hypothetical protein